MFTSTSNERHERVCTIKYASEFLYSKLNGKYLHTGNIIKFIILCGWDWKLFPKGGGNNRIAVTMIRVIEWEWEAQENVDWIKMLSETRALFLPKGERK